MEKEQKPSIEEVKEKDWGEMDSSAKIDFLKNQSEKILEEPDKFSDKQIEEMLDKIDDMWEPKTVDALRQYYRGLLEVSINREFQRRLDKGELTGEELYKIKEILEKENKENKEKE